MVPNNQWFPYGNLVSQAVPQHQHLGNYTVRTVQCYGRSRADLSAVVLHCIQIMTDTLQCIVYILWSH